MEMLELLTNYSMEQILIFIILFGLGIKGIVDFWDWMIKRLRQCFNKEDSNNHEIQNIYTRLDQENEALEQLASNQEKMQDQFLKMSTQVSLLLQSDMDDIKSFITKEHHFYCYEQGWIDDYNLNCIEQRYSHYKEEGGNSFIHTFMEEIRTLPKTPQDHEIQKE